MIEIERTFVASISHYLEVLVRLPKDKTWQVSFFVLCKIPHFDRKICVPILAAVSTNVVGTFGDVQVYILIIAGVI